MSVPDFEILYEETLTQNYPEINYTKFLPEDYDYQYDVSLAYIG